MLARFHFRPDFASTMIADFGRLSLGVSKRTVVPNILEEEDEEEEDDNSGMMEVKTIRYCQDSIAPRFRCGEPLRETIGELRCDGMGCVRKIPAIEVLQTIFDMCERTLIAKGI